MKNHYHLLLSPVDDDPANISRFMKKLNMGYARYFNERYDRSGYLWQGKYKKILVEQNSHFIRLPYYIHLNPLDYYKKENWRKGSLVDIDAAISHLDKYRWSSHLDYQNQKNFPSLINSSLLHTAIGTGTEYTLSIRKYLQQDNPNNHIIKLGQQYE